MDVNREKAIDLAVSQIERQFGKGAIMKLGEGGLVKDIPVVSTGSLGLDIALGIGGVPRGRVVEIYGPEASGKTTLALQIVAEAQKQGGMGAFIDAEHALDLGYAKKLGVKTDDLLISQPDHGEQALEIAETLVRSGAIDVLVIDSVAALVPKAEIEGEMGDAHMGLQARLMSQALRKLTGTISRSQTIVIFINQIRMKIGVMFGNPETTTGGNALKFYASVRMDIRRIGALKEGDNICVPFYGNAVHLSRISAGKPEGRGESDAMTMNDHIGNLGNVVGHECHAQPQSSPELPGTAAVYPLSPEKVENRVAELIALHIGNADLRLGNAARINPVGRHTAPASCS